MVQRNERQHVERASCKMSVKTDEGREKSARENLSLRRNGGMKATHFVVDGCQWLATGQTLEQRQLGGGTAVVHLCRGNRRGKGKKRKGKSEFEKKWGNGSNSFCCRWLSMARHWSDTRAEATGRRHSCCAPMWRNLTQQLCLMCSYSGLGRLEHVW
jgi:hypothetical protein